MHIENRPKLKSYLSSQLPPLTEADPDVLGDYIIALLENSPFSGGAEFEASLVGKLDDFLSTHTKRFVGNLERYLSGAPPQRAITSVEATSPLPPTMEYDEDIGDDRRRRVVKVQQDERSRNVCNDWKRGTCQRGSRCRYAHPTDMPHMALGMPPFMPPPPFGLPPFPLPSKRPRLPNRTIPSSPTSAKLVIDKIPTESCTISAVHGHFAQFGTIVNIDLAPEMGRARIQYAGHEEASRAYSSPEVIFNNRFVKVFWDNEDLNDVGGISATRTSSNQQQQQQQMQQNMQRNMQQITQMRQQHHRPLDPQEELLRKRKETLDAFLELQKQKEALLQKYFEQQKSLLERIADLEGEGKEKLMAELKIVEQAIQTIKPPSAATTPALSSVVSPQLQANPPILRGGPVHRGRGRAFGTYYPSLVSQQPSQQPAQPASYTLDLRPKTLKMAPIPAKVGTDPSSIRKFFEPYGQVANLVVHAEGPDSHAFVTFLRRPDAEKALFYLTKSEEDVSFTWDPTPSSTTPASTAPTSPTSPTITSPTSPMSPTES